MGMKRKVRVRWDKSRQLENTATVTVLFTNYVKGLSKIVNIIKSVHRLLCSVTPPSLPTKSTFKMLILKPTSQNRNAP